MSGLFPPPEAPAHLYVGKVMHQRLKPRRHRFSYRVFTLLIDLKRLEDASTGTRLFSVDRFNLFSFHQKDHGQGGADLAADVERMLHAAGVEKPARLALLCYPRVLGYVFNPLSTYFAYDASDRLIATLHEVRNTFGDTHSYLCPIEESGVDASGLRQEADKLFYVSPFIGQKARYLFRIRPPTAGDVALRILETDETGPLLAASFTGRGRAFCDREIARLALAMPFMTLKVMAGIHFEALRLFAKGISFHHRPAPPPPLSLDGRFLERADPQPDPRKVEA